MAYSVAAGQTIREVFPPIFAKIGGKHFCMVVTQVNSKGPLALPIAARQNMELKNFINKML